MSEENPTPAHLFGVVVAQMCEQRIRQRDSKAYWPGRLTVLAAEALLEQATAVGMDTKAVWAEFEQGMKGEGG